MDLIRNTLVRDKVPELVSQHNIKPITTRVVGEELLYAMQKNLVAGAQTLCSIESRIETVNQLTDLQELMNAMRQHLNISDEEFFKVMTSRRQQLGGYAQGYFVFSESNRPLIDIATSLSK